MARAKTVSTARQSAREARAKRQQLTRALTWTGVAVLVVGVIAALVWMFKSAGTVTSLGEEVGGLSRNHQTIGTVPGPYITNPPAGGDHYPETFKAGFFDDADLTTMPAHPEGYLVHDLEHGYIIYWYNCKGTPSVDCNTLKSTLKQLITDVKGYKIIAFPWPTQTEPLVITSWGRILRMTKIDAATMRQYYNLYLEKSPEPGAQ